VSSQPKRAENARRLDGGIVEVGDEVGEIIGGNAAVELAVELVGGLRGERVVVDGQRPFHTEASPVVRNGVTLFPVQENAGQVTPKIIC
jgi:hypothetical protein